MKPRARHISAQTGVSERLIHINAGSELILRHLFARFGQQVHLQTPTYVLFPEIAQRYTETRLLPEIDFNFDLAKLAIQHGTTLAVIVNRNNPNGGIFDMTPLPDLLRRHPGNLAVLAQASQHGGYGSEAMIDDSLSSLAGLHSGFLTVA